MTILIASAMVAGIPLAITVASDKGLLAGLLAWSAFTTLASLCGAAAFYFRPEPPKH